MEVESLNLVGRLNLRDLGGKVTDDGRRVRTGLLYRAGQAAEMTDEERAACTALGLSMVIDLRTQAERDHRASEFPAVQAALWLDVLGPDAGLGPARLGALFADPKRAAEELGGGALERLFTDSYRSFVTSEHAQAAYRRLLQALLEVEGPVLFHCTAGKDRTGWASALLLSVLGVERGVVEADYLLTNQSLEPAWAGARDQFAALGGDPAVLEAALVAAPAYLSAAFDELETHHGGATAYVSRTLGLGDGFVEVLRARLLEPAAPG